MKEELVSGKGHWRMFAICKPTYDSGAEGLLHESFTHECLKSSLAFRKPATAVASRRPARADGPKVGLDGHEGLSVQRCAWRAVQHQQSAAGGRILLANARARLAEAAHSAYAFGCRSRLKDALSACR